MTVSVGDHPGQSVVGGHGEQGDDRLRGISLAAGRGSQAVADLDAAAIWLALEAASSRREAWVGSGAPRPDRDGTFESWLRNTDLTRQLSWS